MNNSCFVGVVAASVLAIAGAAGDLKSGPQVGEQLPGPFHPLNINGAKAGKKNCLV
jgi:hypothetical protein